jgi:hypothetical protein
MKYLLILALSIIGLAANAGAATTDLACTTEQNWEFHLLVDFGASNVTYSYVNGGNKHSETHAVKISDVDVSWSYNDSDGSFEEWHLSRDTGALGVRTSQQGQPIHVMHASCHQASNVF